MEPLDRRAVLAMALGLGAAATLGLSVGHATAAEPAKNPALTEEVESALEPDWGWGWGWRRRPFLAWGWGRPRIWGWGWGWRSRRWWGWGWRRRRWGW